MTNKSQRATNMIGSSPVGFMNVVDARCLDTIMADNI